MKPTLNLLFSLFWRPPPSFSPVTFPFASEDEEEEEGEEREVGARGNKELLLLLPFGRSVVGSVLPLSCTAKQGYENTKEEEEEEEEGPATHRRPRRRSEKKSQILCGGGGGGERKREKKLGGVQKWMIVC